MSNTYFQCKQFTIHQDRCAMKVCTDACLFGAWVVGQVRSLPYDTRTVLDIGTGTGLLSLMMAQNTLANIDAIELDEQAAEQARENIEASTWHKRCQVITGDARIVHLGRKYDFIVSNPPFYENDLKSGDAKRNLALHSESLSLEELLHAIKQHLNKEGKFALLLPYHRKNEFEKLAKREGFFMEAEVSVKQTPKHSFFRAMVLYGTIEVPFQTSTLTIREEDQYTPTFIDLLKDYYLHLSFPFLR